MRDVFVASGGAVGPPWGVPIPPAQPPTIRGRPTANRVAQWRFERMSIKASAMQPKLDRNAADRKRDFLLLG
jgi:hypothetical protein